MRFWVIGITAGISLATTAVQMSAAESAADDVTAAQRANARNLEIEARNREIETGEQIKRQRIKDRQERAAIRARLAKSGTLTTSGTPLLILGEAAARQNLAIMDAVRGANRDASALRQEGGMKLWEADANDAAAKNNSTATAVSGVASAVGSSYSLYRTK